MDYRAILRNANVNLSALSFSEQTKLINALHAAHSAGYVSGYSQAISAPHIVYGLGG